MNEKSIIRIFKKELNQEIVSIIDKSKGVDQEVKIVETNNGKFVIKIPHKEKDKILKEVLAIRLCSEKNIPVPKVFFFNDSLIIESYIEGTDIDDLDTSQENFKTIYYEIGKLIKKMHLIKGKKFGSVSKNILSGNYKSQKDSIQSWILPEIKRLENTNHYSNEEMNKIRSFFKNNLYILETKESVLLHSDITDSNIIIKNNKVSGFIDFGDLSTGPAMQDFVFMYINHYGDYKFEKLIEGYGEINFKEVQFYAFCWMCWLIASKIEKREFDEKYIRMNKLFKKIWF